MFQARSLSWCTSLLRADDSFYLHRIGSEIEHRSVPECSNDAPVSIELEGDLYSFLVLLILSLSLV